jgi:hypothetical protein
VFHRGRLNVGSAKDWYAVKQTERMFRKIF